MIKPTRAARTLPATLLAALLATGCAHMEAPPGGPADAKRPYVTAVFPAPDTVNAPRDLKVRIAFSEWVAPDAERGKVYLNPPLTHKLKIDVSGNLLEASSASRLDSNTTYTLGILGTVKDLHGLPLESPLQLSFATGPKLDSGRLQGREGVFQTGPAPGAFAALYPRGADLRARFRHLTSRLDSVVTPSAQPDPGKERPAYIAPCDSQGRFSFQAVRPGRYGLIGFLDANGDMIPNLGSEAVAIGPSVDIAAAAGEPATLTLAQYDTLPLRLAEARWATESVQGKLAYGTVRLKFNRLPHPILCLRRDAYTVKRLGPPGSKSAPESGAPIPVRDVCVNPNNGEVELLIGPLDPDSQYLAACPGLRDAYGNLADTARNRSAFRVGAEPDTARPDFVFLGARKVSGDMARLTADNFMPSQPITVYYPRLLSDTTLDRLRANLVVKLDSLPATWSLERLSHHEFTLRFQPPAALKGQKLSLAWKAKDSTAPPAKPAPSGDSAKSLQPLSSRPKIAPIVTPMVTPIVTFTLADAAKLGSVKFRQAPSAYGSRLVLRGIATPWERSRLTPAKEEMILDSIPEGNYAVEYFRDTNGDGIWHPGSLAPWAVQEPYARFADSVNVKAGVVARGDQNKKSSTAPAGADSLSNPERKLSWPPAH
ncbi:MAG: Ig-like domain-containing protein [Fibrobacteria bacterium]